VRGDPAADTQRRTAAAQRGRQGEPGGGRKRPEVARVVRTSRGRCWPTGGRSGGAAAAVHHGRCSRCD